MAALNQSMSILNKNTALLNRSLSDVQDIRNRMASLKVVIDNYDSRLREIQRNVGDVQHKGTQLESELDGINDSLAEVKVLLYARERDPWCIGFNSFLFPAEHYPGPGSGSSGYHV